MYCNPTVWGITAISCRFDPVILPQKKLTDAEKVNAIIALTCNYFNVSKLDIESQSREREVVTPRQIAMYLIHSHCEITLKKIGKMFGGRDHSTVIYAKNTVLDLSDTDKVYKKNVANINTQLINIQNCTQIPKIVRF